ncbi:MAG: MBL fold metallo-hydrolase [Myxococcales bacterium]|nr:MBL fold metallo-hydrolase [Myxococcales bacterium]
MRPLAVLAAAALAACCEFSGPHWHGRKSDHFDGERFHNVGPGGTAPGAMTIVSWRLHRHQGPWPDFADAPPAPAPPERVEGLRVTLVNHATVLIQFNGFNLLTDPIWGEIAGPLRYLGRRRHRPPGLRLEDLPPIDVVLISHDHYDHLDVESLGKIVRKHNPRIVAGLGMAALLAENDIHGVTDLDWWQWVSPAPGLRIYGVPARHDCRRGPCDDDARLWLGFVVRTRLGDVYFAGDTGYGPHLQAIADRFGSPLVALLPIAPGSPRDLFAPVHMDAHEAVLAARVLKARTDIPIHFGTFAQGDEGDGDAERKLRAEMGDTPFVILHNGETFTSSPAAGGS